MNDNPTNAEEQYQLGLSYANGENEVPKDLEKAVYWYTQSSKQGNANAQYNLGLCYKNGWGATEDLKKAVYCFTKAAEQGEMKAQYNLGICYRDGLGVPEDAKKAIYWLNKAVKQGYTEGQKYLTYLTNRYFIDPRDDKIYKIVKIGDQVWMAENLNYECEGSRCYDNDPSNAEEYGRLYDWETAMKACPPGWHIPSKEGWRTLVDYAGGFETSGNKLKAKSGWFFKNGTDDYGFSALPGGAICGDRTDFKTNLIGMWWGSTSCTEPGSYNYAYYHWMSGENDKSQWEYHPKSWFHSVRCVQNSSKNSSGACYIATCVYGSYDCPEVWTLRQFRDNELSNLWLGRQFIRIYYAVSPKIVELFGNKKWFSRLWKPIIDKIVHKLQRN